jgi:hypothetical protein
LGRVFGRAGLEICREVSRDGQSAAAGLARNGDGRGRIAAKMCRLALRLQLCVDEAEAPIKTNI